MSLSGCPDYGLGMPFILLIFYNTRDCILYFMLYTHTTLPHKIFILSVRIYKHSREYLHLALRPYESNVLGFRSSAQ